MESIRRIVLLVISVFLSAPFMAAGYVDVTECGVVNDGITVNTGAIQTIIDNCACSGGGTLFFPPGDYLTGSVFLKDNITLYLCNGARIVGSTDMEDYFLPESEYVSIRNDVAALVNAEVGEGILTLCEKR